MESKLLRFLIKDTKVSTEHQKWPKIVGNSLISPIFTTMDARPQLKWIYNKTGYVHSKIFTSVRQNLTQVLLATFRKYVCGIFLYFFFSPNFHKNLECQIPEQMEDISSKVSGSQGKIRSPACRKEFGFCKLLSLLKLDGVGPVDNRPSTDQLHHFVIFFCRIKNKKIKKIKNTCDR